MFPSNKITDIYLHARTLLIKICQNISPWQDDFEHSIISMCWTKTLEGPKGVEPVHAHTLGGNLQSIEIKVEPRWLVPGWCESKREFQRIP